MMQPPGDVPEIDSDGRPFIVAGLVIVALVFGGLGTWAAVAPLSGAVIAPGVVTVETNRKTVQHLEGGIVAALFVREGQEVARGDRLIRLDDTRVKAQLLLVDGRLDELCARKARLMAERDGAATIAFPAVLTDRGETAQVAELLKGQSEIFAARQAALLGEISVLKQRTEQLRQEIEGIRSQQKAKGRQVRIIKLELKDLKALLAKGLVPRPRLLSLEREAERLNGERGEHVADIARANTSIGEAELQILQLKKSFRERVVTELRELETEMFDLTERRVVAVDEMRRLDIRAPQAGRVVGLEVHTIGAVVGPGQNLMDIVPGEDKLVVEGRVTPEEVDKVSLGLEAVVILSAFERNTTPELNGTVTRISADRLVDPATNLPYYSVRIQIPTAELARIGDLQLRAGMPAECFIQTGARTALSYLMKPFNDAARRVLRDG